MEKLIDRLMCECTYRSIYVYMNENTYLIYANDVKVLKLLNQYLNPFMQNGKLTGKIFSIYAICSDKLYSYVESGKLDKQSAICIREETQNYTVKFNSEENLSLHITKTNNINLGFIQDIYCDVREKNILCQKSTILFHGAAISYKGVGTMIIGNKGSGKSFLSDYAIYIRKAYLVAADQTIVMKKCNGFMMNGNITSYRIMPYDNLYITDVQRKELSDHVLKVNNDSRRLTSDGKINLSPMEAERMLHVKITQNVVLHNIIVLCNEENVEPVHLLQRYILNGNYTREDLETLLRSVKIYYAKEKEGIMLIKKIMQE